MGFSEKTGLQLNDFLCTGALLSTNQKLEQNHLNLRFSSGRQERLHHAPVVLVSCPMEGRGAPGSGGVNIRPVTQQQLWTMSL